jgi:hypothetical protein
MDCIELTRTRMKKFKVLNFINDVDYGIKNTRKQKEERVLFEKVITPPKYNSQEKTLTCYINNDWKLIKRVVTLNKDYTISFKDKVLSTKIGITADPHDF